MQSMGDECVGNELTCSNEQMKFYSNHHCGIYDFSHLKNCKIQNSKVDPLVEMGCCTHPKFKRELSLSNISDTTAG